jgi:thiosulfate/3-mercaptopyruvate sulfurtransferase
VNAALLDGGLTAFSGDLEQGVNTRPRSDFSRGEIPGRLLVSLDEVRQLGVDCAESRHGIPVLLDAREAYRYRGDPHPLDNVSGHIPGARSLPCREHVDEQGKILPREQLRARLTAAGITSRDTPVISSCGSGVTACHNLLVLEHLGLGAGRLYPGSWSQWSSSETTIAIGDDPCSTLEELN